MLETPRQAQVRGGASRIDNFADDDYMVQGSVANSGEQSLWVRYQDANNGYQVYLDFAGDEVKLYRFLRGNGTELDSSAINIRTSPVAVKIKVDGGSIKVWLDGSLKIDASDGNAGLPDGGVAFGEVTSLDDLKIGYDTECDQGGSTKADDDIDP